MADRIFYFILVPMVYAAFAVFFLGLAYVLIGILRAPGHNTPLRVFPAKSPSIVFAFYDTFLMPAVRKSRPVFWIFLILYHIAFLLLILGHLDLFPGIHIMPKDSIHMIGRGAVGIILTITVVCFLVRRFASPVREVSTAGDYLVLLLLFLIFLSGGMMSWSNSWNENGFVLTKADFGEYFRILSGFTFEDPRAKLDGSHYIHVAVHVFLANLFLMVFPFTKFTHTFLAMAANRLRRG